MPATSIFRSLKFVALEKIDAFIFNVYLYVLMSQQICVIIYTKIVDGRLTHFNCLAVLSYGN